MCRCCYWRVPAKLDDPWKRETVDDKLYGVVHHLHAVKWNPGKRDDLLVAGFDGIVLYTPSGRGDKLKFDRKQLAKGDEPRDVPGAGGMTQGTNDVYPDTSRASDFSRRRSRGMATRSSCTRTKAGSGSAT